MAAIVAELIAEVLLEAGELGAEVAAEEAAVAEVAAINSEIETTEIVSEEVSAVMEQSIDGVVDQTVSEEIGAEVESEVESEIDESIEEDTSAEESGSSPSVKTILKWANRIILFYSLADSIGKEIYSALHPLPSEQKPTLSKDEEKELNDLLEADTDLKVVFQEMKKTMEALKSEDLGTINVGAPPKPVYVSDVIDGLLAQVKTVSSAQK